MASEGITEAAWQSSDDAAALLVFSPAGAFSPRRLRLLFIGGCRQGVGTGPGTVTSQLLATGERFADGEVTAAEVERIDEPVLAAEHAALIACTIALVGQQQDQVLDPKGDHILRVIDWLDGVERLGVAVAILIRDICGNPFRPVAFAPEWRTSTAVALARAMYEARDFAPMPVLADALEDAGCEHPDVIGHCRDPQGVHVRGCWVVDGVLGLS